MGDSRGMSSPTRVTANGKVDIVTQGFLDPGDRIVVLRLLCSVSSNSARRERVDIVTQRCLGPGDRKAGVVTTQGHLDPGGPVGGVELATHHSVHIARIVFVRRVISV